MQEAVLYDENPSVRALISKKLTALGLTVVELNQLEETESKLMQCRKPSFLIIDLSRRPEYLIDLQTIVPKYIHTPTRCILTSVRPTTLAHFLPTDIESCFFSHVVERPFKTPEFIKLVETEYSKQEPLITHNALGVVNSSVNQITGPCPVITAEPAESKQVEDIVKSISMSIDVLQSEAGDLDTPSEDKTTDFASLAASKLNNDVDSNPYRATLPQVLTLPPNGTIAPQPTPAPATPKPANHTSRISRKLANNANQLVHANPPAAANRQDTAAPETPRGPDSQRAIRSAKATLDAIRGRSGENASANPSPSADLNNPLNTLQSLTNLPEATDASAPRPTVQRDNLHAKLVSHAVRTTPTTGRFQRSPIATQDVKPAESVIVDQADNEDEMEHTMLVTQDLVKDVMSAPNKAAKLMPVQTGQISLFAWLDILRKSFITGTRYTLEIGSPARMTTIIIELGCAIWAETCQGDKPKSTHDFFASLNATSSNNLAKLDEQLSRGTNITDALISLDLYNEFIPHFEKAVVQAISFAAEQKNVNYRLFEGTSKLADALLQVRPSFNVTIAPLLFDLFKTTGIELGMIRFRKFLARPARTLMNAQIKLDPQEERIVMSLKQPMDFETIKTNVHCDAAAILPKLALFEFIDMIV